MIKDLKSQGIKTSLLFQQKGCALSNPASDKTFKKSFIKTSNLKEVGFRYAQSDCRLIKVKVANKDLARELAKKEHSVGLHAVHTKDYREI